MRFETVVCLSLLSLILIHGRPARAAEVSADFETTLASTYVFRGIPQYQRETDPSAQLGGAVSLAGVAGGTLSVGLWNATALTDYADQDVTRLELDVFTEYARPLSDALQLRTGYVAYLYPDADVVDAAHELTAGLDADLSVVTGSVEVAAEFVRMRGAYASASVSRSWMLGSSSVTPRIGFGMAGYDGVPFEANDAQAGLAWTFPASETLTAAMSLNYAYRLGSDVGDRSVAWAVMSVFFAP